jgi:acetoin utilization protein AcuB
MLVKERMTQPVITALPEMPIQEALNLMREKGIRRLPVVDNRGRLVGIVSDRDLLHASPSDATSLSIWELNYLLSRVTLKEIMTKQVVTVSEDTSVEEVARIMVESKIGGIPVVSNGDVVGIITETDLFGALVELLEK